MHANELQLTIAMPAYDHVHAVVSGEVAIAGVRPRFVELAAPQPLSGLAATPAPDVFEMPAAEYATRRLAGDEEIVALPVFTSRMFQQGHIYVRKDRIREPEDLRGARIGTAAVPDAATALVYARGLLSDSYGVRPDEMTFVPAGPGRDLLGMLAAGEVDALMAAAVPAASAAALPHDVGRLFSHPGETERAYLRQMKVFPIIRVVGVRRELLDRHRWLATNIYRAFEVARRRYFARLTDIRASRVPVPSVAGYLQRLTDAFGGDPWPYGVEPNRPTLEALLRYAAEQRLIPSGNVDVASLFWPVEPFVDG